MSPVQVPRPATIPTGGSTGQVLSKTSATDYATQWVNQTGGGSGSTAVLVYEATGVTGTTVTLPQTPMTNGITNVLVNGQGQQQTRDWTISGAVLTFTTALSADDVHVEYAVAPYNPSQVPVHYETTLAQGQSAITLPQTPSGIPLLSRSGVIQYQSAGHYSLSGATVTLAVPIGPSEDGRISIDYIAGGGTDAATVGGYAPTQTAPFAGKIPVAGSDGKLPAGAVPAIANLLTNGGFEVWQRGNGPFTATTAGAFTADRWFLQGNGSSAATVSRNTANVDYGGTCAAVVVTATTTTSSDIANSCALFSMNLAEGQPVWANRPLAFSIRVAASVAGAVVTPVFYSGGWTQGTQFTLTQANTYYTVPFLLPAMPTLNYVGVFFHTVATFYADNAMLVVGTQTADYAPLHPADDLARCLRYYESIGPSPANGNVPQIKGYAGAAGVTAGTTFMFAAKKAVVPTITIGGTFTYVNASGISSYGPSVGGCYIQITASGAGEFTAYSFGSGYVTAEANP